MYPCNGPTPSGYRRLPIKRCENPGKNKVLLRMGLQKH
jgi:hypothetical protein